MDRPAHDAGDAAVEAQPLSDAEYAAAVLTVYALAMSLAESQFKAVGLAPVRNALEEFAESHGQRVCACPRCGGCGSVPLFNDPNSSRLNCGICHGRGKIGLWPGETAG